MHKMVKKILRISVTRENMFDKFKANSKRRKKIFKALMAFIIRCILNY